MVVMIIMIMMMLIVIMVVMVLPRLLLLLLMMMSCVLVMLVWGAKCLVVLCVGIAMFLGSLYVVSGWDRSSCFAGLVVGDSWFLSFHWGWSVWLANIFSVFF